MEFYSLLNLIALVYKKKLELHSKRFSDCNGLRIQNETVVFRILMFADLSSNVSYSLRWSIWKNDLWFLAAY